MLTMGLINRALNNPTQIKKFESLHDSSFEKPREYLCLSMAFLPSQQEVISCLIMNHSRTTQASCTSNSEGCRAEEP